MTIEPFAAALLDPQRLIPSGLRVWNGSDPSVRLAVHRNNVVSSLVDALADTFPVVEQLVDREFFRAMAVLFVRQAPPRSRVLVHYGQAFPAFIADFEPAQGLPYLADMARLEVARVVAHHAADADSVSSAVVSSALACGDRVGELQLVLHPSVATLVSPYAVVSLWAAHQTAGDERGNGSDNDDNNDNNDNHDHDHDHDNIGLVDVDVPESALILRSGLDVLVLRAPAGAITFVDAVQSGLNLGAAAACAVAASPHFDLTATLSQLLTHGALTALHLPRKLAE